MIRLIANTVVDNRTFIIPYLLLFAVATLGVSVWEKERLFFLLHDARSPLADVFFKYVTYLGEGAIAGVIILSVALFHFGRAAFLLSTFLFSGLLAQVFKKLIFSSSLRPSAWFEDPSQLHLIEGVTLYKFNSFPSGHTTTAFAAFLGLALIAKNKSWGYLCLVVAVLVGYSRVYIGQHFFEDIYFGSFVGVSSAMLMWAIFYPYFGRGWAQKSLLRKKS